MTKTVLALVPHPDDAEFSAGGTLALWARAGWSVVIVTTTDGNKGSYSLNSQELVTIRADESHQAAEVLGAQPPILLGYHDQELEQLPTGELRERYIRLIRQYKPDILVAGDLMDATEVHPDHREVNRAASDAVNYATLPLVNPEHLKQGLQPHYVPEKYFYSENPALINKVVDISATFETKMKAIACHASQVEFLIADIQMQARQAGLDIEARLGEMASDPLAALTWAMHTVAKQIGVLGGAELGEGFRYVRFHPMVESLLA